MTPHKPIPLVLCEGKEDRLIMEMLAKHAGLEGKLAFEDYGGESKLREYLATLIVSREFRRGEFSRILVTRDADKNFEQAWASLKGAIQAVFSSEPVTPGDWISTETGSQVSAWVIPGPDKTGMIETLCLEAARSKSPSDFGCLDPLMDCLEKLQGEEPHEKIRFAIWTIIAQGTGAKKRLSLERAIDHLPNGTHFWQTVDEFALSQERNAPFKERTVWSKERTVRSKERNVRSKERTARSQERNVRSQERNVRSQERTVRSKERNARSKERTARSQERNAWSKERNARSQERTAWSKERTARSKERNVRSQERNAPFFDTVSERAGRFRSDSKGQYPGKPQIL